MYKGIINRSLDYRKIDIFWPLTDEPARPLDQSENEAACQARENTCMAQFLQSIAIVNQSEIET